MRTIKFRGKTKQGEWVVGYYVGKSSLDEVAILSPTNVNYDIGYINDSECCYCIADTIGQLTSLYDCHGKEIYEGDLLVCDEVPKILSEVYWNCSMSAFCFAVHTITEGIDYGTTPLGDVLNKFKSLHIVGNIHDNHELLKGGEK